MKTVGLSQYESVMKCLFLSLYLLLLFSIITIIYSVHVSLYQVLENEMEALQNSSAGVLAASKLLIAQMESQAVPLVQSETRLLSRDLVRLGQVLTRRRVELQVTDLYITSIVKQLLFQVWIL